jgi:hypothetical protein
MRTFIKMSTVFLALLVTMSLHVAAATPEQEKAFTDKYKKRSKPRTRPRYNHSSTRKGLTQRLSAFTK